MAADYLNKQLESLIEDEKFYSAACLESPKEAGWAPYDFLAVVPEARSVTSSLNAILEIGRVCHGELVYAKMATQGRVAKVLQFFEVEGGPEKAQIFVHLGLYQQGEAPHTWVDDHSTVMLLADCLMDILIYSRLKGQEEVMVLIPVSCEL